jgi:hypothetical protein
MVTQRVRLPGLVGVSLQRTFTPLSSPILQMIFFLSFSPVIPYSMETSPLPSIDFIPRIKIQGLPSLGALRGWIEKQG